MRSSRVLAARLRCSVLVSMKSGDAFRGVLVEADNRALVLRNAEQLLQRGDVPSLVVDGEVILLLADVGFIQRPTDPRTTG